MRPGEKSTRTSKVILIGEAPSRTSDPSRPFSGRSGERLRRLLDADLSPRFDLVNLFDAYGGAAGKGSKWNAAAAKERAAALVPTFDHGRRVLLVGRRVATAFTYPWLPVLTWTFDDRGAGFYVAVIPHPSGIVRWWNEKENVEAARRFLRSL